MWRPAKKWTFWTEYGFGAEIVQHNEKENPDIDDFPCMWCTYLFFSDKQMWTKDGVVSHPYIELDPITEYLWNNREALNGLGWNGGITFDEFTTDEKGVRRIKMGDDYSHLWDRTDRRFELYNLEHMKHRILDVAAEANELFKRVL